MQDAKWTYINTEEDIENFLKTVSYFHDSCIKELKYISGSYVDKELAMRPFDDLKAVSLIIQQQSSKSGAIELEFEGVARLNLVPTEDKYSSDIFEAFILTYNNYIYFSQYECEVGDLEASSEENTWIKARKLKWRFVEDYLGSDVIYVSKK